MKLKIVMMCEAEVDIHDRDELNRQLEFLMDECIGSHIVGYACSVPNDKNKENKNVDEVFDDNVSN